MKLLKLPFWDFFKKLMYAEYSTLKFSYTKYWLCVGMSLLLLIAVGLICWLICAGIYNFFDKRSSTKETLSGELVDKKYMGQQPSPGAKTAVIPNSISGIDFGLIPIPSHIDEQFLFFIKADKAYKIKVNMQQFYGKSVGEKVMFEVTTGGRSKNILKIELTS